jgi:hypothetical protein
MVKPRRGGSAFSLSLSLSLTHTPRELQELHTELGPFAFTTAVPAKTAAGAKPTSGKAKKAAKKAKRATAKKAKAAAGQAAAVAPGAQIDDATAQTAAVIVLNAHAKQAQSKKAQASTQHTHAPAHVMSTTAAAQKKEKGRRQRGKKTRLDDADKKALHQLDVDHMVNLRNLIRTNGTQEQYAEDLHTEFVRYAEEKKKFYNALPEGPNKQFFVKQAQHNLQKATDYKPRTTFWPPKVFEKYREIKLACIQKLEEIDARSLPSKDRKDERQEAFRIRKQKIEALLDLLKLQEDEDVKRAGMRSVSAGKGDLWSMKSKNGGYQDVPVHGNEKKEAVLKAKTKQEEDDDYLQQHYYSQQHARLQAL